jgi:outer membrane protein OmpA-like peptidoglycan-associated protein
MLLTSVLVLTACSTKPVVTPKLIQAQKDFTSLQSNPSISEEAPLAWAQAEKIYSLSKRAKSKAEADHLAYLLERESAVAKESARKKVLEKKILSLKEEKSKALLDAKESELLLLKKQMQQAKAKLKELEELNAKETRRGLVLTLGDVLFTSGKADLLPGAQRTIAKLAQFLEENPERKVLIEGHTDNIGSTTYNLDLSLRRAQAVKEALVEKGVDPERIVAQGYGEIYPVASNSDAAGRQRNRRVEIVILKEGVSPEEMQRTSE